MSPGIKAFLLMPICSHTLHNKPIVVSDAEKISIKAASGDFQCALVLDGINFATARSLDSVRIDRAPFCAKFIRFKTHDFYLHLFNKLNYWGATKETEG